MHVLETKIRTAVVVNLLGIVLYQSYQWENTNASWLHGIHVTDLFIALATLLELRSFTGVFTLVQAGVLALDVVVTMLTAVMVGRCVAELSESCTTRALEGAALVALGGIHSATTALQITWLYRYFYTAPVARNYRLRKRNAHLLKITPVVVYLLVGRPAGSDVLIAAHLLIDVLGALNTFSARNWNKTFLVVAALALGLDLLLLTRQSGDLKSYTVYFIMACDVALVVFNTQTLLDRRKY